jgi:molybdopterin-binding protein
MHHRSVVCFLAGLAWISIAVSALIPSQPAFAQDAPRTVLDSAGRRAEISQRVSRILAAGPPASILLYTLMGMRWLMSILYRGSFQRAFATPPGHSTSSSTRSTSATSSLALCCRRQPQPNGRNDMKISARNALKGKIVEITKGATTAHVKVDIGGGTVITSSITNAAVDDLKLAVGKDAYAIVKASDVMIGTD